MSIIGDVFGLTSIYERQVENIENDNFESWPESALYGYYGGGYGPASEDTVDRIDFSNDTTSAPANELTQARRQGAAVSTGSYGYFAYGYAPGETGSVDRLDFSSETCSYPGNNLPQARRLLAAVSNESYGYFGGGYSNPPAARRDTISRIDFSNETGSAPTVELSDARYGLGAVSSDNYGYFGGGNSPAIVDTVDRLDFSNETFSLPGNELSNGRWYFATVSNNNYGYFGGGIFPPGPAPDYITTVDRIDFSSETFSLIGNNLSQARGLFAGVSSRSYGYFCGGYNTPPVAYYDTVDRIEFSNETISAPGNELTQARRSVSAVTGGASYRPKGSRTYGYFGGGFAPPYVNTVDRLDFSNETLSLPGNELTQARYSLAAVSSNSYGYFCGGSGPSPAQGILIINLSNETISRRFSFDLTQPRLDLAAVSSNSYGYFGGGITPGTTTLNTTVDRLDFSNETTTAPGNNLSQARSWIGTLSNSSYGYFIAGYVGPDTTAPIANGSKTVDRIDFSNETVTLPGNQYSYGDSWGSGGVSTNSYGYLAGALDIPGWPTNYKNYGSVKRYDFSTELFNNPPSNEQPQSRGRLATVTNDSYGYFGGGFGFTSTAYATVDRIDFSNETLSAPGNDLPEARYSLAALSN